jgi:hypothetical protein
MNIDQVDIHDIDLLDADNIIEHKQSLINDLKKSERIYDTISNVVSISKSDLKYVPALFHTNQGYRGGYIISKHARNYEVLFTRDEFGCAIDEIAIVPDFLQVFPDRKNTNTVWIKTYANIKGKGYVKAGMNINIKNGMGSGVNSVRKNSVSRNRELAKYPIYYPLTFHNFHHRNTLTYASSFILQLINEYLRHGTISTEILEQAHWLINVVLTIDNYSVIPRDVFLEALMNFCLDYITLSPGSLIRQPINYVFDILTIDGVYSDGHLSVSYIPIDFDHVIYYANN